MGTTRPTAALAAVLTAAVAVGSLALATPATADPTPAGTYRKLVGVGSDTTQDVLNALAGDIVNGKNYAATAVTAEGAGLASYDALDPVTGAAHGDIRTRQNGPLLPRPNGSGEGRQALSASLVGSTFLSSASAIGGQVDFARSSGGPSATGTALTFIPFARDAVGYVAKGDFLKNLTPDQLKEIYSGSLTELGGHPVNPLIPQSSSGTRKFFLSAIGIGSSPLGSNVHDSVGGKLIEENRADGVILNDGDLIPFSAASWIAQTNGIAPDRSTTAAKGGAFIGSVALSGTTATSPVAAAAGGLAPNTDYFDNATFGRDVYNVVPSRAIDPTGAFFDKALYDVFVTNGAHKAALASDDAKKVIADFGFLNESYNGSVNPAQHAKLGALESGAAQGLPTAVRSLTATTGAGSLKASWTAPAASDLPVTDYRVLVTRADGSLVASKDLLAATTSLSLTGLPAGRYGVEVYANSLNGAGVSTSISASVPAIPKSASKVTAKAAPDKVAYGKVPHIAVTVTGTPTAVPTGKVTVREGKATLGTGTLNKAGQVSVALSSRLTPGWHNLTVAYDGDSRFNGSSGAARLGINRASASVSAKAPASVRHTARAKVAVTVTAQGTVPGGKVQILEGRKVIATGVLRGGKVTVTLPKLKKGKHVLHAVYTGSSTVAPVSGRNTTVRSL
ncbi:Ig-like domain repeat protein [Peterkaempfera bronchialis]|uniref:Fibronectin type-III domain-containing protein n=1 Tax=Peterkaempfera bronchialis TaxID=2126346 RepID=A0A345SRB9_9ACTN|nr:Ig-like domain repeat protein [Peterkaempfera bronchialis]AXI76274.1 hypothetical protein C7M71_001065 [Peterkaempfera bronchialis]